MKRSFGIRLYTEIVLGLATGNFVNLAANLSSKRFAIMAVLTSIAIVIDIMCGFKEDKDNEKKDK